MADLNPTPGQSGRPEVVKSRGAWPFATQLQLRHLNGREEIRHSRAHRKHLPALPFWEKGLVLILRALWMPRELNWWIGVVFALGASLFALGCVLFLAPSFAAALNISEAQANGIFFLGSIPFTIAAYLQLYQAANAGPLANPATTGSSVRVWFGWRPGDAGWLSCALQFLGTLLFNLNTFDAMHPGVDWWQQDLEIWVPNLVGSILFLASGYLAWIEVCHAHWALEPGHISWCVGGINLIGCIAFMASALLAFVPPHAFPFDAVTPSLAFTLIGAIAFFIGALLLLPETAAARLSPAP
jgi:hypothetical protein